MKRLAPALLALVLLALGAPLAAAQGSGSGSETRNISVRGANVISVAPDTARLGFGVREQGRTPAAAVSAVAVTSKRVIAALQNAGLPEADVRTGAVEVARLRPTRRGESARGFVAFTSIRVTTQRIRRLGTVISQALRAGASSASGPRFSLSNPDRVFERALVAAFDQARRKAERLAERAGVTLGEPLRITEGGAEEFFEFVEEFAQRAPSGVDARPIALPLRPAQQTVTASVSVVFAIE
jgi:uncharacterized protein YggE